MDVPELYLSTRLTGSFAQVKIGHFKTKRFHLIVALD
jgi:hypothetical protein